MKSWIAIAVVVAIAICGTLIAMSRSRLAQAAEPSVYGDLRARALKTSASDLGVKLSPDNPSVYGVVMDMGLPEGSATLAAYATGDASLYLSTGGRVIGGIGHSDVRHAAGAWMKAAQSHLDAFSPAQAYPLPSNGRARFYILTNHGILTAEVSEEDVDSGRLDVSPVWFAGQSLLGTLKESANKPVD